MNLQHITPVILTFNEEANIDRTLARLAWAPRVVVVDSYSTDRTLEQVQEHTNVDVYQRAFDTHQQQWNYAIQQAKTSWVLTLDADYMVPEAWVEEVRSLPADVAGYATRFTYCIFGKTLRGSLYPPRTVLFRVDSGTYQQDGHTQRLLLEGRRGILQTPLRHDDRKPLPTWLTSQQRYARAEVEKLTAAPAGSLGLTDRLRRLGVAPLLTPAYCLVRKGLLLDGWAGLYYTAQRTYAEVLLLLYLLDARLRPENRP